MQTLLPSRTLRNLPFLPHPPLLHRAAASPLRPLLVPLLLRPDSLPPLHDASPAEKRLVDTASESDDEDDEDVAADDYEVADFSVEEEEEEEEEEEYPNDEVEGEEEDEEVVAIAVGEEGEGFNVRKRQRVARLLKNAKEFGEEMIEYGELEVIYDFPIDRFQRSAIQAFLRGSSVVVSAPTSSGKTLIAEAAAVATVARGRRLFYTTPLKALSNQKFREFRETFGESFVGLLTGDTAVNRDAQILIMTTEILRNMLYQSIGTVSSGSRLFKVDVIVLDEVHYLSDISRGTVWEETVIYCPKEVQLLCLSATVANPDELAGWINQIHAKTELVTNKRRPVPLTWHFSLKSTLLPLLDGKGSKINRKLSLEYLRASSLENDFKENNVQKRNWRKAKSHKYNSIASMPRLASLSRSELNTIRRSQVPQIKDTLRQLQAKHMLPAVWFIFSRRGCDAAVQYLETCNLLDECEAGEVQLALRRFQNQYPDAVRESAVRGLLRGVAAHHAGCLPLWKSFIEDLFQKGLLKVVFATETLAAGINMPARTAVISSLSKRGESGRITLTSNELHQMAGRAGRRGIDKKGHAVLVQTPYEGAEECCEILLTGLEPLVSQFTASYGMVLNLLSGRRVTHAIKESDDVKASHAGRTLDEARKLVEQSFGNYVGSNVMIAVKEEVQKIQAEIDLLSSEISDNAVVRKCQEQLSAAEYHEISSLYEELQAEKRYRTMLQRTTELKRLAGWKPVLEDCENGQLPFICLHYKDKESIQHSVTAVFIRKLESLSIPHVMDMIELAGGSTLDKRYELEESDNDVDIKPSYYVALGSDNSWYLFTEKWIKTVYRTGLPDVPLIDGDTLPHQKLRDLLVRENLQWEKLADSEFGELWSMEGSLETWSWSLNVPVLSSLSEEDEVKQRSQEYLDAIEQYREQRSKVSRLKKNIKNAKGFKEFENIVNMISENKKKIERLESRAKRLTRRMEQIEPSGWKEFLQISNVIHEARALDVHTHVIFPLGDTAAAIRGENELWLAMVLRNKLLLDLKPAQLAAVCGSLVSEGIRVRPWKGDCYIYEPSTTVVNIIELLEDQRMSLLQLQEKHGVKIPCDLESQFSGMVEAWASGLTWREMMMDSAMDEGDLARLLRRTIDLLAQIPKLPDIDPALQNNAKLASDVMDRSPISELVG